MPTLNGVFRLGRDAEVRYLPDGTPVATLSVAYNYGKKDGENHRPSQWVEAGLWGDRAEKLAPYLLKGSALELVLEDVHLQEFTRRDSTTGIKFVGRVLRLDFVGGRSDREDGARAAPPQRQAPPTAAARPAPSKPAAAGSGFDDMEDDIPF